MRFLLFTLFAWLVVSNNAAASENLRPADPLFQSHEVLEVRISLPLTTLMRDRPDEEELAGSFAWSDQGQDTRVAVDVRTRGNYRRDRDICPFAPIRLDFKKSELDGTLLDGQDKLKLVTHCREGSKRDEQALLKEYLAYRMFNALTLRSFNVRLLSVTYVDTERNNREQQAFAFLIEDNERLARRQGLEVVKVDKTSVEALDPAFTNLVSLFAYFAGNTDFSPVAGPPGDECCHNIELFSGADNLLFPVPYDFDMTGIVDARYAAPNPRFGIRNVRKRLYRGRCENNAYLPESIATFLQRKDALYTLVEMQHGLTNRYRKETNQFLDRFYETISDEDEIRDELIGACLQRSSSQSARIREIRGWM